MDEMYKKKPWISAVLKTNNSVSTPSLSEPNVDEEKTSTPSSKIELPSKRKCRILGTTNFQYNVVQSGFYVLQYMLQLQV